MVAKGHPMNGPKLIAFEANRPFILQIVDRRTNLVIFSAACINPSSN